MSAGGDGSSSVLVWFEDNPPGRAALLRAERLAEEERAHLTVLTVATPEPLVGCGHCRQASALWNVELKKLAHEELVEARSLLLTEALDVSYETVAGEPVEAISETAQRTHAGIVVLPPVRRHRLGRRDRRDISQRVRLSGPWRVVVGSEPTRVRGPRSA